MKTDIVWEIQYISMDTKLQGHIYGITLIYSNDDFQDAHLYLKIPHTS